jgi:hypothetical protein
MLGMLNRMADDETELAKYGRIFDEAKNSGEPSQGIPAAILALPDDAMYTAKDCLRDGAALMPNADTPVNVVVADTPGKEEIQSASATANPTDANTSTGPTFFTAPGGDRGNLTDANLSTNATVFVASDGDRMGTSSTNLQIPPELLNMIPGYGGATYVRVKLHQFQCIEASGDGIMKTKDEIM